MPRRAAFRRCEPHDAVSARRIIVHRTDQLVRPEKDRVLQKDCSKAKLTGCLTAAPSLVIVYVQSRGTEQRTRSFNRQDTQVRAQSGVASHTRSDGGNRRISGDVAGRWPEKNRFGRFRQRRGLPGLFHTHPQPAPRSLRQGACSTTPRAASARPLQRHLPRFLPLCESTRTTFPAWTERAADGCILATDAASCA